MKARLVPLYFETGRDQDFDRQVANLGELLLEEAEILNPLPLGAHLPEADAVVFPQLLGNAYRQAEAIREIQIPRLIITSEFGTMSMWDWEIASYLKSKSIDTIACPSLEQTRIVCRALGIKRELKTTKFLVFQDNPGKGFQADIFKRFFWWEDECTQRIFDKFGISIVKKSYKDLAERAKQISDDQAQKACAGSQVKAEGVSQRALWSALKLYLVLKRELEQDESIRGIGINCLNESHFSDTTPCLAWNLLYEERGLIWGCEADTVSMLSQYILHKSLGVPVMMSNLYPFLLGQAATKHEHIPGFPVIHGADDHILVAHCGYLGVMPVSFSTEWTLKPKVLAIVDDNATAIDARLQTGDLTLAKLDSMISRFSLSEAELVDYIQYPNSDTLNGAIIRVPDGRNFVDKLVSHHYVLITGHQANNIKKLAKVFDLDVEEI
ncbi:MAG: hypothetical protein ABSB41_02065 [Anaerolineales bacterium]|jgi:hypothetical protein